MTVIRFLCKNSDDTNADNRNTNYGKHDDCLFVFVLCFHLETLLLFLSVSRKIHVFYVLFHIFIDFSLLIFSSHSLYRSSFFFTISFYVISKKSSLFDFTRF